MPVSQSPKANPRLPRPREKHIFGGLPVQPRFKDPLSGLAVIDLLTGNLVGTFEFTAGCTEIYDNHLLPVTKTQ